MKYTAEEVRAMAKMVRDEFSPHAGSMLTAFAERIKADEGAVTDVIVEAARKAYRSVETRELCPICGGTGRKRDNFTQCEHCEGSMWTNMADAPDPMRAALLAVWPNPPAQAAQVDDSAVASFVERAASVICGKSFPTGSALAKAREISDLALSMLTTPEPVALGDASPGRCKACGRATRAVCDGLDGNGLGCTNAPSIDLSAVRKVIAHLRQFDSPYTRGLADKLEAAIKVVAP